MTIQADPPVQEHHPSSMAGDSAPIEVTRPVKGPIDPRLLRRSRATRRYLLILVALGVIQAFVLIGQAWLLALAVSGMVGATPWQEVATALLGVAIGFVLRATIGAGQQWAGHRAAAAVKSELRRDLLAARLADPFNTEINGGRLLRLVTEGVEALDSWFSGYLPQLVLAIVVPAVLLVAIGAADLVSMIIIIVTLPLIPLFMILIGLATRARMKARWRSDARLAHHFADLVAGLSTLQIFGRARSQAKGLQKVEASHRRATMSVLRVALISALVLEVLATLSVALVAVSIGLRVVDAELSLFVGLFVLVLAPEVYLPWRQVGARYHDAADGMAAADDAFALIDRAEHSPGARATVDLRRQSITFTQVALRPAAVLPPVIEGLSLTIAPGQVVGLAGTSGIGKSTVLRALLGHAPGHEGQIRIGQRDLAEIDLESLRQQIAWVEQDPALLPGTIADNVALSAPGAPISRVRAALTQAGAGADLFPEREVAADGSGLSAGEVRRIALARALLKVDCAGAQLLLLDEPTAGLDTTTEATVIAELSRLGLTIVMVSHRAHALGACDSVMDLSPHHRDQQSEQRVDCPPVGSEQARQATSVIPDSTRSLGPQSTSVGDSTFARVTSSMWLSGGWQRSLLWLGTLILGTAAAGSAVALLGVSGWLLARASEHPPVLYLLVAVVGVRFFGLGRGVFRYAERLAGHHLGLRDQSELRVRTYQALASSPTAARSEGETVDRLVGDVSASQDLILRSRMPLTIAAVVSLGVVIGLGLGAPLVGLLFALQALIAGWLWPRIGAQISLRADGSLAQVRANLAERAWLINRHAAALATHHRSRSAVEEVTAAAERVASAERRAARARAVSIFGQLVTLAALWPLMVITAQQAAEAGRWSMIMVAAVALIPLGLQELYSALADARQAGSRASKAMQRVQGLIDDAEAVEFPPGLPELSEPGVRTRGLVLIRGELPPLDLQLGPGERLVLVGPSGIGKSTLLNTLMGQLRPLAGEAAVGGRVSCLTQQAHVFDTTVTENLKIGDPDADHTRLREVLSLAGAASLDLERRVGEHGRALSGGEARRLALARVLLARPSVLLLDEPTEHLDLPTARALLADLHRALPNAAILAVSHQPAVISEAWGASTRLVDVTAGR